MKCTSFGPPLACSAYSQLPLVINSSSSSQCQQPTHAAESAIKSSYLCVTPCRSIRGGGWWNSESL